VNTGDKLVNWVRKKLRKDWVSERNGPCPACGEFGWTVTVRVSWPFRHFEGKCACCCLYVPQFFGIEQCRVCGAQSWLVTAVGGYTHPFATIPVGPSGECVRCCYSWDAYAFHYRIPKGKS
jgi:hypothetical protein